MISIAASPAAGTAAGPTTDRALALPEVSVVAPLPDAWIVRAPWLVPALVPFRFLQVARRAVASDPRLLVRRVPLVLLGLTAWSMGCLSGLRESRP